jgi:peptide/nickel transport system permease protein
MVDRDDRAVTSITDDAPGDHETDTADATTASGGQVTARRWRNALVAGLRRTRHIVIVLFLVSLATFSLMQFTPGDPAIAILGEEFTEEEVQEIHEELGLDRPVVEQYFNWIGGVLTGDFGKAFSPPSLPVSQRLRAALPVTIELTVMAMTMALVMAVPIAVFSAYRTGRIFDRIGSSISFGLLSVPTFVVGLVLALLVTLEWDLLPRANWVRLTSDQGLAEHLRHAVLPAFVLSLHLASQYTRLLRADMIQTLQEDYVAAARARGLSSSYILFRHALRPSTFSLVTLAGVNLGHLIGGTAIVETIFGLPGMGYMLVGAVQTSDFPLVQGIVFVVAVLFVLINAVVDVLYRFLDPRTKRVDT